MQYQALVVLEDIKVPSGTQPYHMLLQHFVRAKNQMCSSYVDRYDAS